METIEMTENIKVNRNSLAKHMTVLLKYPEVVLMARGTNMKKCIDLAVIAERDFKYTVKDIKIYDSVYTDEEQKERHISNIEITISK